MDFYVWNKNSFFKIFYKFNNFGKCGKCKNMLWLFEDKIIFFIDKYFGK